jgi:hypothetical protein
MIQIKTTLIFHKHSKVFFVVEAGVLYIIKHKLTSDVELRMISVGIQALP